MKRETKIASIIVILLAAAMVLAVRLNQDTILSNQETLAQASLNIYADGVSVATVDYEQLLALGGSSFEAVYDTSTTQAVMETYTGVELQSILTSVGISLDQYSAVVLTAVDNYGVAYTAQEVAQEGNVYVAYERNGAPLTTKEDGGEGPLQSIVVSDTFSNRRCKWLISIEVTT